MHELEPTRMIAAKAPEIGSKPLVSAQGWVVRPALQHDQESSPTSKLWSSPKSAAASSKSIGVPVLLAHLCTAGRGPQRPRTVHGTGPSVAGCGAGGGSTFLSGHVWQGRRRAKALSGNGAGTCPTWTGTSTGVSDRGHAPRQPTPHGIGVIQAWPPCTPAIDVRVGVISAARRDGRHNAAQHSAYVIAALLPLSRFNHVTAWPPRVNA